MGQSAGPRVNRQPAVRRTPIVLVDYLTGEEQRTHANQAIEVCPTGAISIEIAPKDDHESEQDDPEDPEF